MSEIEKKENAEKTIEDFFRKKVRDDHKIKNAYLLVHSDPLNVHFNIAEGSTGDIPANPDQPNYMASVGKLFTSTLVSILYEEEKLSFDDSITSNLNQDFLNNLHVFKGEDYTDKIEIRHLLNHASGLYDIFWPLVEQLLEDPELEMSPKEAIIWGKNNRKPYSVPGEEFHYTDTNYHLLGLIIEEITEMPFQDALKDYIFEPLDMNHSYMLHYSEPIKETQYQIADFFIKGTNFTELEGYAGIDYAGGGIVGPLEDLLKFMKALANNEIIKEDTLEKMMKDRRKHSLGIDYGYGIWQLKTIPLFMPKKYNSWGAVGATGAFMFYHPKMDTYLIGNFNDLSYEKKCLRFMGNVINRLGDFGILSFLK